MIKELIKLANDLDDKGLTKEADDLDQIIAIAIDLSDRPFFHGGEGVSETLDEAASAISSKVKKSLDSAKKYVGEKWEGTKDYAEQAWEGTKETAGEVSEAVQSALEAAKNTLSGVADDAYNQVLSNPEVVSMLSVITKIAALGAIIIPEPTTSAAGLVVFRSTAGLDLVAATGYFFNGRPLNGWFSILSAVTMIPASISLAAWMAFLRMTKAGGLVLLSKTAPAAFTSSLVAGIDVIINIVENTVEQSLDERSSVSLAFKQKASESSENEEKTRKAKAIMRESGNEILDVLKQAKTDLYRG